MKLADLTKVLFRRRYLPLLLAVVTWLLTLFTAHYPSMTEAIYSGGVYPIIATMLSGISRWVPFSLDDLFYGALILLLLLSVVLLVFKKIRFKRFFLILLNTLASVYVLFYWLWGFNYFREDFNTRLGIASQQPDTTEFNKALEQLIDKTNSLHTSFDTIQPEQTDVAIEAAYREQAPFLHLDYPSGRRRPKFITLSDFFAKATISGYYGPFFNEVHVNKHLLPVEYPMVLAHEKAHQFGITSEAEANFYAWYVCNHSASKAARYSANLYVLTFFLRQGRQLDQYSTMVKRMDEEVKDDIRAIYKHWMALRNAQVDEVAAKVNDAYLKTNNVQNGIADYNGVVQYVMDYWQDNGEQL
ncbi:DUF3810 domain-containing protein [Marinilabiliaceae bacterium JC017]|nr:DUF3810 domain-containing protein [Marinilabiliaceae bacterium JC017]